MIYRPSRGVSVLLSELELERLAAIPRGVELLAGGERDADVVDGDLLALSCLVAVADLELRAGHNTLRFTQADQSAPEIDSITVPEPHSAGLST